MTAARELAMRPALETAVLRGGRAAGAMAPAFLWSLPGLVLFGSMLLAPTVLRPLKAALLAVVLCQAGLAFARSRRPRLDRGVLLWGLLLIGVGLAFITRGLVRGEPGAWRVGTVYAAWPAAFLVLVAALADPALQRRLFAALPLATVAIAALALEFLLEHAHVLPRSLVPDLHPGQVIGIYDGYVEVSAPSLSTLLFTLPFLIASALTLRAERPSALRRAWVWLALLCGLVLALFSGRRALMLIVALAPLLTLGFAALLPPAERGRLGARAAWLVVLVALGCALALLVARAGELDLGVVWQVFREGFDPRASESSSIRALQLGELLRGWEERPLLGTGHGGFLRDHIRDPAMPWAYELSYPTLLYQTGLLGFALYAGLVGWILRQLARMVQEGGAAARRALPVAVGTCAFLLANATNPYLLKFDFLWVLFLPVALVNGWRVAGERRAEPGEPAELANLEGARAP